MNHATVDAVAVLSAVSLKKRVVRVTLTRRADPVQALDKVTSRSIMGANQRGVLTLTVKEAHSITAVAAQAVCAVYRFARQS